MRGTQRRKEPPQVVCQRGRKFWQVVASTTASPREQYTATRQESALSIYTACVMEHWVVHGTSTHVRTFSLRGLIDSRGMTHATAGPRGGSATQSSTTSTKPPSSDDGSPFWVSETAKQDLAADCTWTSRNQQPTANENIALKRAAIFHFLSYVIVSCLPALLPSPVSQQPPKQ